MKPLHLWLWTYWDPVRRRRTTTRYRLTEEDALARLQDPQRLDASLEVRMVPETDAERAAAHTGNPGMVKSNQGPLEKIEGSSAVATSATR